MKITQDTVMVPVPSLPICPARSGGPLTSPEAHHCSLVTPSLTTMEVFKLPFKMECMVPEPSMGPGTEQVLSRRLPGDDWKETTWDEERGAGRCWVRGVSWWVGRDGDGGEGGQGASPKGD